MCLSARREHYVFAVQAWKSASADLVTPSKMGAVPIPDTFTQSLGAAAAARGGKRGQTYFYIAPVASAICLISGLGREVRPWLLVPETTRTPVAAKSGRLPIS